MPALTACLACRALKAKCRRGDMSETCLRCDRLGIECESIPRRLGRRLGSKNRPKTNDASTSDAIQRPSTNVGAVPTPKSPPYTHPRPVTHHHHHYHQHEGNPHHSHTPRTSTPSAGPSFSNMLNVLAKVANDMPPNPLPSSSTRSPEDSTHPFDRRKFLEMYRHASRTLDPDPFMGLVVLEQGLDQLFEEDGGETAILPGEEIVYLRVDQPRRDVAPEYDLLTINLLSETEIEDLLEVYWTRCNPIIRLLDPSIHTVHYLRSTSAILFTAILQVAAQCLPVSRHSSSLVSRLDTHIDMLYEEVTKRGLQSIEICQALLMHTTYMRASKQHQTWQYVAQAIAMALELRLEVNSTTLSLMNDSIHAHIPPERKKRNIERCWLCINEWDKRLAFIRGRRPILRDSPMTSPTTLRTWYMEPNTIECDVMTCATVDFRDTLTNIQRAIQKRMTEIPSVRFEDHLSEIDGSLEAWRSEWFDKLSPADQKRMEHDRRAGRFVLLMIPYEHRLSTEGMRGLARDECLIAALDVCKNVIPIFGGALPGMGMQDITAARLYLTGYTALCALRIMDSSPRDDDRQSLDVDLFHLSILSALATKLCHLNVHPNTALIASVLGRRLLYACRKVLATTMSTANGLSASDFHSDTPSPDGPILYGGNRDNGGVMGGGGGVIEGNGSGSGSGGGSLSFTPHDVDLNFDFSHVIGDLFPFFDNDFASTYVP
ncbi:hypothetical protein CI109_101732 [Kwoniella shandongensis]|uniref:Uncharacterized protein n=1 Tax=Kwoniella shandongensis TaxID=1734106 RepID=A0A5M6C5G2_9TREE|nr:uncharacterized protein CI109_001145 [Kwoniella shandongensis]KAA5530344.1 hypothetical protein CI109_001145 [Kwoniella shandongensis]